MTTELYADFKVNITTIGSTRYKQIDWSPMLSGVFIKTASDNKYANFRQIKDFFGEDASHQASQFIMERTCN
jgi:hypothetical protein